jgi:valyl-tRNA synthetase
MSATHSHAHTHAYIHLHAHAHMQMQIPIVTDGVLVDMAFGTGAVKITPAHDPNDYECGKRNNLQFINILNADGTMNSAAAQFEGLPRYDARVRQKITQMHERSSSFLAIQ